MSRIQQHNMFLNAKPRSKNEELHVEEESLLQSHDRVNVPGHAASRSIYLLIFLLVISLSVNSLFYFHVLRKNSNNSDEYAISRYGTSYLDHRICYLGLTDSWDPARLKRDIHRHFPTEQRTMAEEEWLRYDADVGQIALDDTFSSSMHLPPTQRWPWNFTKGMYYLQGYHNLHCLYTVRDSLVEFREGRLQSEHPTHVDHCLIELRDDVLCNADDTPRYTGGEFGKESGEVEQTRMCRSWDRLVDWAMERSACYRSPEDPFDGVNELERYKFCPDGSTPWVGAKIWEMVDSQEKGRLHPEGNAQ